jgi:predicted phosphodiesterase
MNIDIISDTHVDFWVPHVDPFKDQDRKLNLLVEKILPSTISNTLVIAGDIGHHNYQDFMFFKILKKYYKNIVWTHGNHDLYMTSKSIRRDYSGNSFNRLNEKIELLGALDNVHYLNGNIVEIDGIKFGGCGMWYSNDYAKNIWLKTDEECLDLWFKCLNDCNFVSVPIDSEFATDSVFDYIKYFNHQYQLMNNIHKDCDVVVSHVSPDWSRLLEKWKRVDSTFFHFDGSELLKNMNGKTWIYGHTHDKYFYDNNGTTMICNPLDYGFNYPNWMTRNDLRKIITFDVGTKTSYENIFENIK